MSKQKTMNELKRILSQKFGKGNVRINVHGEVHVNGIMPNTNTVGWYLLCHTFTTEFYELTKG
jgi:hypothetical protein